MQLFYFGLKPNICVRYLTLRQKQQPHINDINFQLEMV
jgi:hypothetical protein